MNKTILIASGVSVASLAMGATGGYFLAKKKFEEKLDDLIEAEVKKTEKYYGVLLAQAQNEKPSLEELVEERVAQIEDDEPDDEEILAQEAANALTNYQGISTKAVEEKPPLDSLVKSNIFENGKKPKFPPRDEHGKFIAQNGVEEEVPQVDDPFLIPHDVFLDSENETENLLWFVNDKTLIKAFAEEIDSVPIDLVGEVNLTLFDPNIPEDQENIICVRNPQVEVDYEIKLMRESLTDFVGLGTEDDESRYV